MGQECLNLALRNLYMATAALFIFISADMALLTAAKNSKTESKYAPI
jgi:hypothetical protein